MNILKSYKYYLKNLDCANCARKIEETLAKNEDFKDIIVNFNTLTVSFKSNLVDPFKKAVNIVKRIEADVVVYKEEQEENKKDYELLRLILAIITLVLSLIIKIEVVSEVLLVISYGLLLYKTLIKAFKKIIKSHRIDENLLVSISGVGAYILGEHMEGLMVLIFYVTGKILEEKAVNKSRSSIKELLSLKVDKANLKVGERIKEVKSENLKVRDIILVRKGEVIPVDGVIIKGASSLDTSSLTGESVWESVGVKSKVLSGSINKGEVIEVEVTHEYKDSTAYKILELTINATNNKAKMETRVSKIASFYTPIVLGIAIIMSLVWPLLFKVDFNEAIYRALTFLVISCPCAMAISVPLSYFAGIGMASRKKILVKGSNYLDEVQSVDTIVFDKTGTLTTGSFQLKKIKVFDKKYSEDDVLNIVAVGEAYSTHPIAKLILNEVKTELDETKVKDFKEIEGKGITYKVDNKQVKVGSASFCDTQEEGNIFVVINDLLIAAFIFEDNIKENALEVIRELKHKRLKTIMLTGDSETFAKTVAKKVEVDEYYAQMLPDEKFRMLEELKFNHKIMFIGDGINDAPSLVIADVGVSMGNVGASAAIEASDIVIMNDDLDNILSLFKISHKTRLIVNMNLGVAIGVKVLILLLAALGMSSMWAAVFADTGLTLLTILNSLRILKE